MTTNTWLAIIAVTSFVQLALVIVVVVVALRFRRQTEQTIAEVKTDVRDAVDRLRRADETVRGVMAKTGNVAGHLVTLTRRRIWPVLGIVSAVRAGASVLFRGSAHRPSHARHAR
jgi:hypothetical protein